jgi:thymidylate kinase
MNKIFVLEGADGTGKSTLANYISELFGANIIHCSYDKNWNIKQYHEDMYECAVKMSEYNHVILDRWSLSEYVYGSVFRNKPAYDALQFMYKKQEQTDFIWIYCQNNNAIENHEKNKNERVEMFDNIEKVEEVYNLYINNEKNIKWNIYNFDTMRKEDFINKLIMENSNDTR